MHPTAQKVADAARALGVDIEVQEHAMSARTAAEAAHAVDCEVGQIVKSLLFIVDAQPTLVLVSGANQLDEGKLAALCGVGKRRVQRSQADAARQVTGFAIGGIPPFGHPTPLPTYMDIDLVQYETIWAAAGTPHAVFAVAPQDLLRATNGMVAEVKRQA